MYICSCSAVTSQDLDVYLKRHPDANDYDLMDNLSIAKCCGLCEGNIHEVIGKHREMSKAASALQFISS